MSALERDRWRHPRWTNKNTGRTNKASPSGQTKTNLPGQTKTKLGFGCPDGFVFVCPGLDLPQPLSTPPLSLLSSLPALPPLTNPGPLRPQLTFPQSRPQRYTAPTGHNHRLPSPPSTPSTHSPMQPPTQPAALFLYFPMLFLRPLLVSHCFPIFCSPVFVAPWLLVCTGPTPPFPYRPSLSPLQFWGFGSNFGPRGATLIRLVLFD